MDIKLIVSPAHSHLLTVFPLQTEFLFFRDPRISFFFQIFSVNSKSSSTSSDIDISGDK